jgi:hypothetical protein
MNPETQEAEDMKETRQKIIRDMSLDNSKVIPTNQQREWLIA